MRGRPEFDLSRQQLADCLFCLSSREEDRGGKNLDWSLALGKVCKERRIAIKQIYAKPAIATISSTLRTGIMMFIVFVGQSTALLSQN